MPRDLNFRPPAEPMVQEFAAWVARQDAGEIYNFADGRGCAFFLFLTAAGHPVKAVGGITWDDLSGAVHALPTGLDVALICRPHTFGALADRLAALL